MSNIGNKRVKCVPFVSKKMAEPKYNALVGKRASKYWLSSQALATVCCKPTATATA